MIKPYCCGNIDHLSVEKDDVVIAINKKSDGLIWIQFEGQEGWIPESHLELAISDKGMNN